MIMLTMATAVYLAGLQASITAPRVAFQNCIKQTSAKAEADKVAGDAYEALLRAACGSQGEKLKSALVAFDVKNGVARSRAAADADADVTDGFSSSVDAYKWRLRTEAKQASAN